MERLQTDWEALAKNDALWAVSTLPDKKDNRWSPTDFFLKGEKNVSSLIANLSHFNLLVNRETALDFGCGVGRLTQALCKHFDKVYGVDISQTMIEQATKYNRFRDKCTYTLNTKDDLSLFGKETFDLVYSYIVLQHMEKRFAKNYLKEFLRITKLNGVIVFQMPTGVRLSGMHRRIAWLVWFKIQRFLGQNAMQMNTLHANDITDVVRVGGGKVVRVIEDNSAGSVLVSKTFYVKKIA